MFFAIDDELFSDIEESMLHQSALDGILNFFDTYAVGICDCGFDGICYELEVGLG